MQSQVAVPKQEPILAAQGFEGIHEAPAFTLPAPALRLIGLARQGIKQRIDVRRDSEAEVLEIIACIDDGGYLFRGAYLHQAQHQLGTAHAPGQGHDPAHRNKSSSIGRTSALAGASPTGRCKPRMRTAGMPSAPSPVTRAAAVAI